MNDCCLKADYSCFYCYDCWQSFGYADMEVNLPRFHLKQMKSENSSLQSMAVIAIAVVSLHSTAIIVSGWANEIPFMNAIQKKAHLNCIIAYPSYYFQMFPKQSKG